MPPEAPPAQPPVPATQATPSPTLASVLAAVPQGTVVPPIPFVVNTATPAIVNALPALGVPASIIKAGDGAVGTGPCAPIIAPLIQSLVTMLTGCLPVAKPAITVADAAQEFLAICNTLPDRVVGRRNRTIVAGVVVAGIERNTGTPQDAADMIAALKAPLSTALANYCGGLKIADATTIVTQHVAALQAVSA